MKWICLSGTQRFCKNDSDSSSESLTVTRVTLWKTWLDPSRHFFQRDSSRVRVTQNRDSSRVIDFCHAITAWGCRFPSVLQRIRSISYRPVLKTKCSGELQESVFFEMTDKSLRVELVIVSLLEHNLIMNKHLK